MSETHLAERNDKELITISMLLFIVYGVPQALRMITSRHAVTQRLHHPVATGSYLMMKD